jgi:membrane-associated protease RseP (regulator of RpoE activity)
VFLPYIAFVVLAVVFMIFLHELGHYLTARWSDMKVTEFFIGFGPRLWWFRRGETDYGVKPIPAGAYVKVVGMNNLEEVDPVDEPRTYRQKSYPRRLAVGLAGSAMHFLLALACIYTLLAFVGLPDGRLITERDASTVADWEIDHVEPGAPADVAGLESGDRVVAVDGRPVENFEELREEISDRPGADVVLLVENGGAQRTVTVTLAGENSEGDEVGFLGIGPGLPVETVGPVAAVGQTFVEFGRIARLTGESLVRFFSPSGLADFFSDATSGDEPSGGGGSGAPENSNRVVSILGALQIGAQLTESSFAAFLLFFVMLNVFVGMFNLIPLLPLDGGHVAIATYERIRSRNGVRYHADVAKMLPVAYAVVAILVLVGITALYLDIVDPINLSN